MKLRIADCGLRIGGRRGFTLVEVILAVVIAAGLLVVAISYYQRSASVREQVLEESDRLNTIRLMMDRLCADLRTAMAEPRQGFTGGADFLRFVHAGSPSPNNLGDGVLKLVSYTVVTNSGGTNALVVGFTRSEETLVEKPAAPTTSTNQEALSFNGGMDPTVSTNKVVEPQTRAIRYAHFRYFSGSEWLESWDGVDLPLGVEVTFGSDPLLPEEDQYDGEQFRRLIAIPAGRAVSVWEGLP
jgi:prepilin-type N-terminal cleavage/methylation domain-containing protein